MTRPYEKTLTAIYALIGRMQYAYDENPHIQTDLNIMVELYNHLTNQLSGVNHHE